MRYGWCKFTNGKQGGVYIWSPSVHAVIEQQVGYSEGCDVLANQTLVHVSEPAEVVVAAVDEAKMARKRGPIDG
jgi:hypothetical protein